MARLVALAEHATRSDQQYTGIPRVELLRLLCSVPSGAVHRGATRRVPAASPGAQI